MIDTLKGKILALEKQKKVYTIQFNNKIITTSMYIKLLENMEIEIEQLKLELQTLNKY